jgi:magnesium transporter
VHIGETKTAEPRILLIEFSPEHYQETTFASLAASRTHQPGDGTLWLNVYGLQDVAMMAEIGRRFQLHPLVMEDVLNTHQRPKIEDYGDYIFIVTHVFDYHPASRTLSEEQISMVLGRNVVLTFQERPAGRFQPLRERLKNGIGQGRRLGAGYLAYSLLDVIVDQYFVTLDRSFWATTKLLWPVC